MKIGDIAWWHVGDEKVLCRIVGPAPIKSIVFIRIISKKDFWYRKKIKVIKEALHLTNDPFVSKIKEQS